MSWTGGLGQFRGRGQARQSTRASGVALGERELVGEHAFREDGEAAHDEVAAQALPEARRALHASERATRLHGAEARAKRSAKRYNC